MTTQDQTAPSPAPAPRQPNTLRTVLLVVGSIVLAIILVGTVARVAFSLNRDDTSGTFAVEDAFDTVELRTSAADVKVQYTDVDEPQIRFDQGGTNLRLDYEVSDGVLNVRVGHPGWGWWGWGFDGWGWNDDAKVNISLPAAMERDGIQLAIETTAGDLNLSGDYGDVTVDSTAGNLRMSGATDDLQISTTAGDVRLDDVAVNGSFRSESTAGDGTFEFRSLPDSIEVTSTAGDVRVALPSGSYRIETDTTAGEVRQNVSSDQNSDRVYRFETTAGNIELNER
ncbi:DUF4097 family beta strand repeat-containing protein [Homoserinimonas sp. A520]